MATKHSILALALALIMMISVSHCHRSVPQNDAVTSATDDENIELPIIARVIVLNGVLSCYIPPPVSPRSPTLPANIDAIVACGDIDAPKYRLALAQTLSDLSLAPQFIFDVLGDAMTDPTTLAQCRVVVRFPGGACGADLAPLGLSHENVISGDRTYSVPVYQAKELRDTNKHY